MAGVYAGVRALWAARASNAYAHFRFPRTRKEKKKKNGAVAPNEAYLVAYRYKRAASWKGVRRPKK